MTDIPRTVPEPERFRVRPAPRETCYDCGRKLTPMGRMRGGCLCLYCITRRKLYQRSQRKAARHGG